MSDGSDAEDKRRGKGRRDEREQDPGPGTGGDADPLPGTDTAADTGHSNTGSPGKAGDDTQPAADADRPGDRAAHARGTGADGEEAAEAEADADERPPRDIEVFVPDPDAAPPYLRAPGGLRHLIDDPRGTPGEPRTRREAGGAVGSRPPRDRRPTAEWVASLEWESPVISRHDRDGDRDRSLAPGHDLRKLRKLLFGLFGLVVLLLLPTPSDLSVDAHRAVALFVFLVYLWVSEALPLPVTALLAGVGLLLLGIKDDPNAAFEPYAQDTFFFILGSLILADGITKSGADEVLAQRLLRVFGRNTHTLLFGIVASTSILAAFVSDHAIAAIMLPIVLGVLKSGKLRELPGLAPAYLLAIAFGANIAGLATPSGGSRNAIALGYLRDLYDIQISYLDWVVRAAPITLVLIPIVYVVLAASFRVPMVRLDHVTGPAEVNLRLTRPQWTAVLILLLTVLLWIVASERYGLGTIAIIGAVLMFVAGILDWEDTRSTIPWGVAFVYGAALVMGRVLKETGAAEWLASHAFAFLPLDQVLLLVVTVAAITVLLTNFMSDGATVAVIAPVTLSLALLAGYSVAAMGMITALSSAFAFILVIGTPPNLIVYASGRLRPADFFRAGVPMTLLGLGAVLLAVFHYWPRVPI